MTIPSIGSMSALAGGQFGVVVGAQRLGTATDGSELVAVKVKTVGPPCECGPYGAPAVRPEPPEPVAAPDYADLDNGQRAQVDRLRQRDQQVRQEEKAHSAVAGDLAGPTSYVYQRGPDGRLYAVGGSVPLEAQSVSGDPAEAQRLGARLAAAAQAATNPSDADLAAARKGYNRQAQATRHSAGAAIDLSA